MAKIGVKKEEIHIDENGRVVISNKSFKDFVAGILSDKTKTTLKIKTAPPDHDGNCANIPCR